MNRKGNKQTWQVSGTFMFISVNYPGVELSCYLIWFHLNLSGKHIIVLLKMYDDHRRKTMENYQWTRLIWTEMNWSVNVVGIVIVIDFSEFIGKFPYRCAIYKIPSFMIYSRDSSNEKVRLRKNIRILRFGVN